MMQRAMHKIRRAFGHFQAHGVASTFRLTQRRLAKLAWDYKPFWTPRRFSMSLGEIPIDRPIFVLGTQGGGLTLITRMMRRNPEVAMIGGGPTFWTGNDEMDKHYVAHQMLPDCLSLRSPRYNNMTGQEQEHPYFGYERSWLYATDELLPHCRQTEADYGPAIEQALRRRIRLSLRAYAANPQRARFLDMSQSFALKTRLIKRCLPDARFVLVVRNPYVMCWREVMKHPADKYRDWNRWPPVAYSLRLVAQHWRNTFEVARRDLEEIGGGLFVRFEDFLEDPEQGLRKILDYADLDFDPDMLPHSHHTLPMGSKSSEKWYPIRTDVNDRYLQSITADAVNIIEEELGGIDDEIGYKTPGLQMEFT